MSRNLERSGTILSATCQHMRLVRLAALWCGPITRLASEQRLLPLRTVQSFKLTSTLLLFRSSSAMTRSRSWPVCSSVLADSASIHLL